MTSYIVLYNYMYKYAMVSEFVNICMWYSWWYCDTYTYDVILYLYSQGLDIGLWYVMYGYEQKCVVHIWGFWLLGVT